MPYGLQGGSATERYHLTADQWSDLTSGLTKESVSLNLKTYITSLLFYNQDTFGLKDKDPYIAENMLAKEKTPIGDVISGDRLSNMATPFETFGVYGFFMGSNWTSVNTLPDYKYAVASIPLSNDVGLVAGGMNSGGLTTGTSYAYTLSTSAWTTRGSFVTRDRSGLSGFVSTSDIALWPVDGILSVIFL